MLIHSNWNRTANNLGCIILVCVYCVCMYVCIICLTNRFVTLTIHILYTMRATQYVHRSVARQWRLIYDLLDPMHASPFIYRLCKCIVLCTPLCNTRRSARSSLPSSFYLEELIAIFSFSFRHHDGKTIHSCVQKVGTNRRHFVHVLGALTSRGWPPSCVDEFVVSRDQWDTKWPPYPIKFHCYDWKCSFKFSLKVSTLKGKSEEVCINEWRINRMTEGSGHATRVSFTLMKILFQTWSSTDTARLIGAFFTN